jgi:hypothetical protein
MTVAENEARTIPLIDIVSELLSLNDDNLAERVIQGGDVQWCLSELYDMLEAEDRYRTLYIEALKKNADDLCSLCQNKPAFSCTKECPNYIEGKDGTIDGKLVDFPWSCMDFNWGECDRLIETPCHGCFDADFCNFALKEPDAGGDRSPEDMPPSPALPPL